MIAMNMNKTDLEHLLRCMIIVSAIDGFDSSEIDLIKMVFTEIWDGTPQELDDLMESEMNAVAGPLAQGTVIQEFEEMAKILSTSLNEESKKKALEVIMTLIKADGKITGGETKLYMIFKRELF